MSIDHHYMLSSGKSLTIDLSNMISDMKCYHNNLCPTIKDNWNRLVTFLDTLYGKAILLPKPFIFQSTAINKQHKRTIIHQPCWKQGRWKSLT